MVQLLLDQLSFLKSIEPLYPFGIPQSANKKESKLSIVVFNPGSVSIDEFKKTEEGILLSNAVTQGLKLSIDKVNIIIEGDNKSTQTVLSNITKNFNGTIICIGGDPGTFEFGKLSEFEHSQVIFTYNLSDVLSSTDIKKKFWQHLKQIL